MQQSRKEQGLSPYANARNAASGALRRLEPGPEAAGLSFWLHQAPAVQERYLTNLHRAGGQRLPVCPERCIATSAQDVADFYRDVMRRRHLLDYEIDGIMVKVNRLDYQAALGQTGREPRWAIAWKFPAEQVIARLLSISVDVGRFGRLTPVAELEPTPVAGTVISRATRHNAADLERRNVRPGENVLLERAGDVIPQIAGPADPDRSEALRPPPWQMPNRCPACHSPVVTADQAHWCRNRECSAQRLGALKHFVSRQAMDIDGLGETRCRELLAREMIRQPADIYFLASPKRTRTRPPAPTPIVTTIALGRHCQRI